jgi:hypothetical protein
MVMTVPPEMRRSADWSSAPEPEAAGSQAAATAPRMVKQNKCDRGDCHLAIREKIIDGLPCLRVRFG